MVIVNLLEPYSINKDAEYLYVQLEKHCFSISIEDEAYDFVPVKANQIKIDRETKKIQDVDAAFAFQNEHNTVYITMEELINIPDFLIKLYFITKPYFDDNVEFEETNVNDDVEIIIDELEQQNVKRLIDKALDERDEEQFHKLLKLL
ncbi:IDEAL domain-containing protein [Oceanobacillus limi]|uniref:IDEAL domain-containing protein n=1 Tax=Oceanobacillus limi TaxID=930131 RepID=A0A1I0BP05_9BACI|nr:IDEAL domain-containing protein [Oceanobacillus limi]SET08709.1 IDEAL domain-containing protein [Oceanobacillus limi]